MAKILRACTSAFRLALLAIAFATLIGCYTQIMTIDRSDDSSAPPSSQSVDTIRTREREVCFWTRDFFGRPYLRCYETYYSRDWYLYNYAPWWDRYDPYWFDYSRCPRYYYYDPLCGCCRYYTERPCYDCPPYSGGGGGGGSSGGSSHTPQRSRTRAPSPPPSSNAGQPKITHQPAAAPVEPAVIDAPQIQRIRTPSPPPSHPRAETPAPQVEQPALPKSEASPPTPESEPRPNAVQPAIERMPSDTGSRAAPPPLPNRRTRGWR